MEDMDFQGKILDKEKNTISYKAVFDHSYHTLDGGLRKVSCIAYFVFFLTPIFHPTHPSELP